jgi:SOS-response transcriptional repressor LexA
MMLTARQKDVYDFLRSTAAGPAPSYDEIAARVGMKSKSGVYRIVAALEERGYVRHIRQRARAIEVIDRPAVPALVIFGIERLNLGDDLRLALDDYCSDLGVSREAVIREAVTAYLGAGEALPDFPTPELNQ